MTTDSIRKPVGQSPQTVTLRVDDLVPDPNQPRKTFAPEGISSLAQSLLETGQISPIVVRQGPEGKYTVVVGERRWRAARDVGLSHIECVIRYDLDEQKAREMQLAENYHRVDIPPLEQARSLKAYLDKYNLSQSELFRRTGIPQRTISDRLALLSLPTSVHTRIEAGEIGPYEALKISALPADQQEAVAQAVSRGRMGGRALEKITRPASEFPHRSNKVTQQLPQPIDSVKTRITGLFQRLENLEKAIYSLAETHTYNEAARQTEHGGRKAPPCPDCLIRGRLGVISTIKRKMTSKDRRELIEAMEDADLTEEDIRELLEQEQPTHVIEAKCHKCGRSELIGYDSD